MLMFIAPNGLWGYLEELPDSYSEDEVLVFAADIKGALQQVIQHQGEVGFGLPFDLYCALRRTEYQNKIERLQKIQRVLTNAMWVSIGFTLGWALYNAMGR